MNDTPTPKTPKGAPPLLARRKELLLLAAVLVAALVWWALMPKQSGAVARVSITKGPQPQTILVPLDQDALLELQGEIPVHLEVKNGAVRFVYSVCPDHLCEDFGWIKNEGEWALCAPAGVLVSIGEQSEPMVSQ